VNIESNGKVKVDVTIESKGRTDGDCCPVPQNGTGRYKVKGNVKIETSAYVILPRCGRFSQDAGFASFAGQVLVVDPGVGFLQASTQGGVRFPTQIFLD